MEARKSGVESYENARGRIDVSSPATGVILARMERHASGGFITPLAVLGDQVLSAFSGNLQIFFDLGDLASYDSAARVSVTNWLVSHRARIDSIHVFTRSKLVGMGVAVANLAVGGMMLVHREAGPFQEAVKAGVRLANRRGDI